MKVIAVLLALACAAAAEPPRPYSAPAEPAQPPYPPSGWRPSGRQFALPARQVQDKYGPPPPPPAVYGPPSTEAPTTTELPETTTEVPESTTEVDTEAPQGDDAEARALAGTGLYYVLLPDGRLQRVAYTDTKNSAEFARLTSPRARPANAGFLAVQFEDVQPIRAPVYAYGSPLVRLFK